jgi:hypothetical protein
MQDHRGLSELLSTIADAARHEAHRAHVDEQRRIHGERVEARQAERRDKNFFNEDRVLPEIVVGILADFERQHRNGKVHTDNEIKATASLLADLTVAGLVGSLISNDKGRQLIEDIAPEIISGKPTLPDEPPFIKFWAKLNNGLREEGKPEVGYGAAREAFTGGPTPVGALTFIGKKFDGIRAVPSDPQAHIGGTHLGYYGEYREVTEEGTRWHQVLDKHAEKSIVFGTPESALNAALARRDHDHGIS